MIAKLVRLVLNTMYLAGFIGVLWGLELWHPIALGIGGGVLLMFTSYYANVGYNRSHADHRP